MARYSSDNSQETYEKESSGANTPVELGKKLAELRNAQGHTLEDVREATKIQTKHIAAIEAGNLEELPKGPFRRSFVKQYCEFLSAPDLWERYDKIIIKAATPLHIYGNKKDEEASYIGNPKVFRQSSHLFIYVVIMLCLAAAAWVTWQYRGEIITDATNPLLGGTAMSRKSDDVSEKAESEDITVQSEDIAEPAATTAATSVDLGWMDGKPPAEPAPVSAEPALAPAPEPAPVETVPVVKVTSRGVTWVKFSIGNEVFFQGTLRNGESREFSPRKDAPLRVRYGNPVKSSVSWNGTQKYAGSNSNPITRYYWYDGTVTTSAKR